jgi:hypothetical protein
MRRPVILAAAVALALGACGGGATDAPVITGEDAASPVDAAADDGTGSPPDAGTGETGGADAADEGGGLLAGCPEPTPLSCPDPPPHYPDVQSIIERRCVVCHFDGAAGTWPLTTYADVAGWGGVIEDDLIRCTMPPADSQAGLTFAERQAILVWIGCGTLP